MPSARISNSKGALSRSTRVASSRGLGPSGRARRTAWSFGRCSGESANGVGHRGQCSVRARPLFARGRRRRDVDRPPARAEASCRRPARARRAARRAVERPAARRSSSRAPPAARRASHGRPPARGPRHDDLHLDRPRLFHHDALRALPRRLQEGQRADRARPLPAHGLLRLAALVRHRASFFPSRARGADRPIPAAGSARGCTSGIRSSCPRTPTRSSGHLFVAPRACSWLACS